MESSVIIIIVLIYFTTLTFASNDIDESFDNKNTAINENNKLIDCHNLDYRTYIKCLRRQKRHHAHGHWDHHNVTGGPKSCYEDCGVDLCTSTQCVHDCHTRCMKKTKETRIVQYETDCNDNSDGNCNSKNNDNHYQAPPNITTNIDVNNIIHNHLPTEKNNQNDKQDNKNNTQTITSGYPGVTGLPGSSGLIPGISPNFGGGGYGLNIVPQIQFVPQLTFGLGVGPIGGCLTNMNWPCIQQQQLTIDCSQCYNPFYRQKCEISCSNQDNYSQDSQKRN